MRLLLGARIRLVDEPRRTSRLNGTCGALLVPHERNATVRDGG